MTLVDQIGRYRTERVLGSGAFATVWLAVDEALDAKVAIKVLAENWSHDEDVRRRFTEEARILWRADSDHIVRVHTVEELPDGRPYFVMAFADRGNLAERMTERAGKASPWTVDEAVTVALDIADGLAVAHRLEIVHRDLKPSNVLYQSVPVHQGGGERLVLADFGIARSLAASRGTTIATGTPQYMAPEQAEGRADERSDLYSAAVILYELLAGSVPYPYDTLGQILRAQREETITPLVARRADVPPELDAVIARAMSMDPAQRPASAEEWATSLRSPGSHAASSPPAPAAALLGATMGPDELARQQAAAATPAPPPPGAAVPAPPPVEPPPPPPPAPPQPPGSDGGGRPPRRTRKRGPWVAIGGLAGVAAIVVALALLASGGGDEETATVGDLLLEPISEIGPQPFTGSLVPDLPSDLPSPEELLDTVTLPTTPEGTPEALAGTDVTTISGAAPGLYGGTKQLSVCDATQLVDFLEANADKAAAWADVVGIPVDEVESYVDDLTDVILQRDVQVTNHGFSGGVATERQSVLQAGTAVLVDSFGVPRVRCYCGNPLLPPKPLPAKPKVTGAEWPGFNVGTVIVIAATDPVDEFIIRDLVDGGLLGREPGTPAENATVLVEGSGGGDDTTSTTEETTTTVGAPSAVGVVSTNASSTFSGEFPASLSVDGDPSTSWFSSGGGSATYQAELDVGYRISEVTVVGNAAHPRFPTGFGFGSVTIEVLDSTGIVVGSQTFPLSGTPDPNVTWNPDLVGIAVRLNFSGGEAANCGGFAELQIRGSPI